VPGAATAACRRLRRLPAAFLLLLRQPLLQCAVVLLQLLVPLLQGGVLLLQRSVLLLQSRQVLLALPGGCLLLLRRGLHLADLCTQVADLSHPLRQLLAAFRQRVFKHAHPLAQRPHLILQRLLPRAPGRVHWHCCPRRRPVGHRCCIPQWDVGGQAGGCHRRRCLLLLLLRRWPRGSP
jgi:hypothetical protein